MSSIRIFILGSLEERGAMHGHQIRLLAEEEHVHLWTDITVGALYGAIKRLVSEGLLESVRTEREGNYPERQVLDITRAGRDALAILRRNALEAVVIRPDPFDLAMTRLDPEKLDDLSGAIDHRIATLRADLVEGESHNRDIAHYLTVAEQFVLTHKLDRIRADISWHESLAHELPRIIADESARKDH